MISKIFIKIIIVFFVLFLSLNVNSELIFKNDFPKDMQGIWSENCSAENQTFIISKNTSMWINDTYVGFNISKTATVDDWIAYKWGELDGSYYYFLKKDKNQLLEVTAPENWDGIDYSFLEENETSVYNKCNSVPSLYQITYGEIINLMNSQLIEVCNNDSNPANCINETFNFLDVSQDKELSVAELTRAARIVVYFTFIDKRLEEDRDIGFATYASTSLVFPVISKIIIGNYDYDSSNTISLKEIYTDRVDTLDYQNLFKDNIKGLDPEELRKLMENLDFLRSILIN
tara:strand:+ start:445 stop:1308 length:864 start_codon:yes stop_codon:yes gene_type:complete